MGATTTTTTTTLHLTVQVLDLSPKVTKDDLIVFFSYCGTVDSIHLQSEGKDQPQLAFVTFRQPFAYQTALLLNGVFLAGHPVRVLALQGSPTPPNLDNMNNLTPSKETQGQCLIPIMQAAVQSMASKGVGILNKTKTELEENCKLAEKGRLVNQTRSIAPVGFSHEMQTKRHSIQGHASEGQGDSTRCGRCGNNHLEKDCRWITGACFQCGQLGHRIANCPQRKEAQTYGAPSSTKPPSGSQNRGTNSKSSGRVFSLYSEAAKIPINKTSGKTYVLITFVIKYSHSTC